MIAAEVKFGNGEEENNRGKEKFFDRKRTFLCMD